MLKSISSRLEFYQDVGLVEIEPEHNAREHDEADDVEDVYPSSQNVDLRHLIRQVKDAHSNVSAD